MIVYISFGNSDDKLSQREWIRFQLLVRAAIRGVRAHIHGEWYSAPDSSFQNACYCIDLPDEETLDVKNKLIDLAEQFHQDAIAWAECPKTVFLGPQTYTVYHPGGEKLNHPGSDRWTGGDRKDEP